MNHFGPKLTEIVRSPAMDYKGAEMSNNQMQYNYKLHRNPLVQQHHRPENAASNSDYHKSANQHFSQEKVCSDGVTNNKNKHLEAIKTENMIMDHKSGSFKSNLDKTCDVLRVIDSSPAAEQHIDRSAEQQFSNEGNAEDLHRISADFWTLYLDFENCYYQVKVAFVNIEDIYISLCLNNNFKQSSWFRKSHIYLIVWCTFYVLCALEVLSIFVQRVA